MTPETTGQEKAWITYDERAWTEDTDDCSVIVADSSEENTLEKVQKYRDSDWPNCPIYEYDVVRLIG
jgi:hypothetical protein